MSARFLPILLVAAGLAFAWPGWAAPLPEAAVAEPGPGTDPLVRSGRLANGFRYALRPHPVPPGRVSLALFVDVGSRHERRDELGYAHFVEHLAFAGSRDFPGDSVIRALQRFGLGFGSEFNASTGRSCTVYEIRNVPTADPAALATALKVLRNFADGLQFDPAAVKRERGVILAEGAVRAGRISYWWGRELGYLAPFRDQIGERELEALFGDSAMGRSQLGTPRALKRATADSLRAFHARWYRPERMVLAVAGELETEAAAQLVEREFASLAATGPAPVAEAVPAPRASRPVGTSLFVEPDSPVAIVTLAGATARRPGDDAVRRREELAESVALRMLERRLSRALAVAGQIEAMASNEVPGWRIPLLRVRTTAASWPAVAVALETEVRRAEQLGFTEEELAAAVARRRRQAHRDEREADSRSAGEVVVALAHAFGQGLTFSPPEEERRWTEVALAALRPEECRAAVARLWAAERTRLVVAGPMTPGRDGVAAVEAALRRVRTARLAPLPTETTVEARLPDFHAAPGMVANAEHDAALDCWLVQFDNGVRLNFKSTRFEPGQAHVRVGFGYGLLGTEPGREGLAFGVAALLHGGIAGLSAEQESELLGREETTTGFGFGADRLGFSSDGPVDGVATVLRLFAARVAKPAFRAAGEAHARAFIDSQLARSDRTAAMLAEDRVREHLFGGHHALTRPRRETTERMTFEELRSWIVPQLETSPIEITIVGDLGLEEATEAVAGSFGALPLRSTVDPMADRRAFVRGPTPQRLEVRYQGKGTLGSVALAWPLPDVVGQEDDCRLRLLAAVLEDRIRVRLRQEMGKTYSPVVGLMAERALAPAMLYLRCRVETAPRQVGQVATAAKQVVAALAEAGFTDEELERARLPLIRAAEENAVSNKWWLTTLSEAQSKPQFVVGQADQKRILQAVTRAELESLARLLFAPDRLCELRVLPD